ncbi:MAG TPA: hypothetical protein VL284_17665 [Thermoanaerobaculia bacterium]|nr:hypothetical protein [Thermoanaerobaculia bacterium]
MHVLVFLLAVAAAPRNYLIADGERFHHQTIAFSDADGSALWFSDANGKGRTASTRISMRAKDGTEFQLSFPAPDRGSIDLVPGDGDVDNLSHWSMLVQPDRATYGDGLRAKLGHLIVRVSKYAAVGGSIGGTFDGVLTSSHGDIHIEGAFHLERAKDVKSF